MFTPLSLLEARVLGVLIEKEHTVPDSYPLTLNALTAGCNQKSARHPVIEVDDEAVRNALDALKHRSLAIESSGGRVMRYTHNLGRVLHISSQMVAVLAVLMLRGPQTPGELRINTERLHRFADLSALEALLDDMAAPVTSEAASARDALIVKLPRQPGSREHRYAHLLSGPVDTESPSETVATSGADAVSESDLAVLKTRCAALESEVAHLRAQVDKLYAELGVARPDAI